MRVKSKDRGSILVVEFKNVEIFNRQNPYKVMGSIFCALLWDAGRDTGRFMAGLLVTKVQNRQIGGKFFGELNQEFWTKDYFFWLKYRFP